MKALGIWVGISLASLFTAEVASAYIPPTSHLIETMTKKRAGVKTLRVRSTVVSAVPGQAGLVVFRDVTIYDAARRLLRSRAFDSSNRELYATERNLAESIEHFPLADLLLFEQSPELLGRSLRQFGIPIQVPAPAQTPEPDALAEKKGEAGDKLPTPASVEPPPQEETTFLGRVGSSLGWAIAPDGKKTSLPQLWVMKDGFVPLRLKFKGDGDVLDIRFEEPRYVKEVPYPKLISLIEIDGEAEIPWLKSELSEMSVNPDLPELKTPIQVGFTDVGNAASGELRDLIRKYYQWIR